MTALLDQIRTVAADLLPPGSRLLVATSGGPDSQLLLVACAALAEELGWARVRAMGVDHGLRSEAGDELDVAEALAESLGVSFERRAVRVSDRGNLMDEARKVRYGALRSAARAAGDSHIAVGHTATDQAETVLLNLTRGSALRGVRGLGPQKGRIVRPLHGITRAEIVEHLERHGIPFVHDPSNRDPRRSRARLREAVLPALRKINPQVEASVGRFARLCAEDEELLARLAVDARLSATGDYGELNLERLTRHPRAIRRRVVQQWLGAHAISPNGREIEALADAGQDTGLTLNNRRVFAERGCLWVVPNAELPYRVELPVPGRAEIPPYGLQLHAVEATPVSPPESDRAVAFDADRLHVGLVVRPWQHGDKMRPYGQQGHVKVGDLFTNMKIPTALRSTWPLVTDGDEILWVVGLRRGAAAPLTPQTRRAVRLSLDGA